MHWLSNALTQQVMLCSTERNRKKRVQQGEGLAYPSRSKLSVASTVGRAADNGGREEPGVVPRRAAGISFGDASMLKLQTERLEVAATHAAVAAAISAGVLLMDNGVGGTVGVWRRAGVLG